MLLGAQQKIDWQTFWDHYRNIEVIQESDLFFQVGKTINKRPVNSLILKNMIEDIVQSLKLSKDDVLMELCCGNGLLTYPLSNFSKFIYAFDFTKQMIDNAEKFNHKINIIYKEGNANSDFFKLFDFEEKPNKFLINDSLAYFTLDDLKAIMAIIVRNSNSFSFYITGIPCEELKWNFYDTEERKKDYFSNLETGDIYNSGMGRWWFHSELQGVAMEFGLKCTIEMPSKFYNYRMNALFENAA